MKAETDNAIIELLENVETIAVIGLSPKEERPSYRVAKHLQSFSYKVIPVRPAVDEVLGEKAYKSLADIPFKPDLVNVFRASKYVADIVDDCIKLGIKKIWLQEGIADTEAQKKAQNADISIVMDRCIYKEIIRLAINQNNSEQK